MILKKDFGNKIHRTLNNMKSFLLALVIGIVCCGSCAVPDRQDAARKSQVALKAKGVSRAFDDAAAALTAYKKSKSPSDSAHFDQAMAKIPQTVNELKLAVGSERRDPQIVKNLAIITETGLRIMTDEKVKADKANSDEADKAEFRARHMYRDMGSLTGRINEELAGLGLTQDK